MTFQKIFSRILGLELVYFLVEAPKSRGDTLRVVDVSTSLDTILRRNEEHRGAYVFIGWRSRP